MDEVSSQELSLAAKKLRKIVFLFAWIRIELTAGDLWRMRVISKENQKDKYDPLVFQACFSPLIVQLWSLVEVSNFFLLAANSTYIKPDKHTRSIIFF